MRVLVGRFDLGEMDNDELVPWTKISPSIINNEAHRKLALEMALESMTLLQNNNNILPLKKSAKKIAVIGPNANDKPMLWGNYNGTPVRTVTILDGITSKLSAEKNVYDKGCDLVVRICCWLYLTYVNCLRVNYEYLFDWGNNENKRRELGIKSKAD